MKRLTYAAMILVCLSALSEAQTVASMRGKHNARVCMAVKLAFTCTQAEATAAGSEGTIYATDAAFRDGVMVKRVIDSEQEAEINEAAAILNRAFVKATKAERTAACAAVGAVC